MPLSAVSEKYGRMLLGAVRNAHFSNVHFCIIFFPYGKKFHGRILINLGLLDLRKTTGLIPDGVTGIFHPSFHNASEVDATFNN